jgi:Domain of unknown function (DUF4397)
VSEAMCREPAGDGGGAVVRTRRAYGLVVLSALVLGAILLGGGRPAGAQAGTAHVVLLHGLQGVVADVYLDGALVFQAFQPERVTDPLDIPAGPHQVDIRPTGAPATSQPALSQQITLAAGQRVSAVAHLDPQRAPRLTVFENVGGAPPPGDGRIIVRNVAVTPAVDAAVDGAVVATGLASGTEAATPADPGARTLAVRATNGSGALPSHVITAAAGADMYVYVIGEVNAANVSLLAQTVTPAEPAPTLVPTGTDGLADRQPFPTGWVLLGALSAGVGVVVVARRRPAGP